ncbi:hypothetical protein Acr_13g0006250 [Actinidia rufa]|uniref:Uncharacterized protein n=1 Tax=Actinidia rufa TaxID=165716 RepID=A0A7J0FKJ8_9ERIC|nr:hypothetical protein Acr_13g0006250 [Actinidia rufa]
MERSCHLTMQIAEMVKRSNPLKQGLPETRRYACAIFLYTLLVNVLSTRPQDVGLFCLSTAIETEVRSIMMTELAAHDWKLMRPTQEEPSEQLPNQYLLDRNLVKKAFCILF